MSERPKKITLKGWDERYRELKSKGMKERSYGGPLSRHLEKKDYRLAKLRFDDSAASLRLWNFLLTEEDRLHQARASGKKIVGVMKDLGTVPVMAYSFPELVAFYPDGAWWIPCVTEFSSNATRTADSLGIDESFCPVRTMLGAFITEEHFPIPDLLTCSVGATCDDLSVIAQRLNSLGFPILWWEIPQRRRPELGEKPVRLPTGFQAPEIQVSFVKSELERIRTALEDLSGRRLDDDNLREGVKKANRVRRILAELRRLAFTAKTCPLPGLEMLIAEMLSIHFCSDREESLAVLQELLKEVKRRVKAGTGVLPEGAVKIFWVNPVADLRVMNLLEDCGGRICGTEYLFSHVLREIPEEIAPMEALARTALADPMVGTSADRSRIVCEDILNFGAEAVVVARIPGASHCAAEGIIIGDTVRKDLGIPVLEIEVPPVSDPIELSLRTRLEALMEVARERRRE